MEGGGVRLHGDLVWVAAASDDALPDPSRALAF